MTDILKLQDLYRQLATHTWSLCETMCPREARWKCCSRDYCEITRRLALMDYGIELVDVNSELPFMGENGCVVEPYLRTTCTKYHCRAMGIGPYPEGDWTVKYFDIIKKIKDLEDK